MALLTFAIGAALGYFGCKYQTQITAKIAEWTAKKP